MLVLIRGGGDLASGVALRLHRAGLRVVICELPQPLAVRRMVAFAEAVYAGRATIEGLSAQVVWDPSDTMLTLKTLARQVLSVLVDPECTCAGLLHPAVIVDARMTKRPPERIGYVPQLYIGLGPGFIAGENCQGVVETRRGHSLGRVLWHGIPDPDTGQPDPVHGQQSERVLRAPADGELVARAELGTHIEAGQVIAEVAGRSILAAFPGVLRGLIHSGLKVT